MKPIFIKLTDLDQNLNPNVAETVITTIKSANGDSETLRLTETGPSTGVFIGYIQSTFGPVVVNDCRLSVAVNTGVNATYTDIVDGSDSTIDGALVDPFGLVFDSTNGNPINGATVTLINTATGAPAQVFCDDGVTPYPASVISGSVVCGVRRNDQPACRQLSLPAGGAGHVSVADQSADGIQFSVDGRDGNIANAVGRAVFDRLPGSRGEPFMLNPGPALQIDVPLDPSSGSLQIVKTSIKAVVGVGEFVPYTLAIRNNSALAPVLNARIVDRLPPGFRYQRGSARLNGAPLADPTVSRRRSQRHVQHRQRRRRRDRRIALCRRSHRGRSLR